MGDERDQSRKRGQQLGGRDGGSLWVAHGDVCSTPVLLSPWTSVSPSVQQGSSFEMP